MSQKVRKEIGEEEKSQAVSSKLLNLLDEHWFFRNALLPIPASKTDKPLHQEPPPAVESALLSARKLKKTLSLPPPRISQEERPGQEEEPLHNSIKLSGRKLQAYSYSSLDAPQLPDSCSSSKDLMYNLEQVKGSPICLQSTTKQRAPKNEASQRRRCANPHLIMCWEESYRKAFQNNKWSSLGDLENMELQGFKDLGFVFDGVEGELSSRLVRVIPGLCGRKEEGEDGGVAMKKPYLSEAWFTQRSAPPMVLHRVGRRSAEEMKEQLRFWARAVACNVRQEC